MLWLLKLGITMLIHNKDDIEFVTEFPCSFGHPVCIIKKNYDEIRDQRPVCRTGIAKAWRRSKRHGIVLRGLEAILRIKRPRSSFRRAHGGSAPPSSLTTKYHK